MVTNELASCSLVELLESKCDGLVNLVMGKLHVLVAVLELVLFFLGYCFIGLVSVEPVGKDFVEAVVLPVHLFELLNLDRLLDLFHFRF